MQLDKWAQKSSREAAYHYCCKRITAERALFFLGILEIKEKEA
jgi:hypothetical protein